MCRPTKQYEVVYSADKAEFRRVDGAITTHLEIVVAPEHCAEVRRVTLSNHDRRPHELELTSYAEVVLAAHAADLAHPAFGKLFLQTEWVASHGALLCQRRPRAAGQEPIWAVHVVSVEGRPESPAEYETDRSRFVGRGRTLAAPAALEPGATLSNTTGPVLDPIFSVRRRIRLEAGGALSLLICTGTAKSREEALGLADHYRDAQAVARVFDLAWAHSQVELRHLQISTADVHLFQRLATHLLYVSPALRRPVRDCRQPAGPARTVALRHLGGEPDPARPRRRQRGPAVGPPLAAGSLLLAPQEFLRRSRHSERAAGQLRRGVVPAHPGSGALEPLA